MRPLRKNRDSKDSQKESGKSNEKRLENDLTRALMVVFDQLVSRNNQGIVSSILKQWTGVDFTSTPRFVLQKSSKVMEPHFHGCTHTWIFGLISPNSEYNEDTYFDKLDEQGIPDAWIIAPPFLIALEVKADAKLEKRQLDKYEQKIKQLKVMEKTKIEKPRILTWIKDVAEPLENISNNIMESPENIVSKYLIDQFIDYLRSWGMAKAKFDRQSFLNWDELSNDEIQTLLRNQIKGLSEELLQQLNDSHTKRVQNLRPQRDYIGANIYKKLLINNKELPPQRMPHWSLGLRHAERRLSLFIQVESKYLMKKFLKERSLLENKIADALFSIKTSYPDLVHRYSMMLRVERKWFLTQGEQSGMAPWYLPIWSFPLEGLKDRNFTKTIIHQAFDTLEMVQLEKIPSDIKILNKKQFRGKAVTGVLQLDACLNWFSLEELGTGVSEEIKEMMKLMLPYYRILIDQYLNA